ncbi:hypothetical protein ACTGZD_10565, partial [Streptococcus parasuis]
LSVICSSDRSSHFNYSPKQRVLHFFIQCCALSETKGMNYNYGFLSHLPLVNSQKASLNFFVVNLGLVLAIEMTQVAFLSYWKKHEVFILQE